MKATTTRIDSKTNYTMVRTSRLPYLPYSTGEPVLTGLTVRHVKIVLARSYVWDSLKYRNIRTSDCSISKRVLTASMHPSHARGVLNRPTDATLASFPNRHLWPHLPSCATCSDPPRPSTIDVGTRQCSAPDTDRDSPVWLRQRLGRDVGIPRPTRELSFKHQVSRYHHHTPTWRSPLGMHKKRASLRRSATHASSHAYHVYSFSLLDGAAKKDR
ncbi:hypothetical protein BC826DRAFT_737656 [Russula brevipes]|nr:hypothetical protein BC826DRAFT_737656 [Russula brevipes]